MRTLRIWIAASLGWMFLFFNIERLHEPINIASFVYVLSAAVGIAIVAVRPLEKLSLVWLNGVSLLLFAALKGWLGYGLLGAHLPLTVTELCAIGVTLWLARGIARNLAGFEKAATELATMERCFHPAEFDHGQEEILREIRRARKFRRPLSVVTIAPTEASKSASVDRFIETVQRETIGKYVSGRFAGLLAEQTHNYDVVARRNNHFVILLPETDRARAGKVVERISAAARDKLGLQVTAGTAEFPTEEVTLAGLLERAEARMGSGSRETRSGEPAAQAGDFHPTATVEALERTGTQGNQWEAEIS